MLKESAKMLQWAIEAEVTAKNLLESGESRLAGRFLADRDAFLSDAAQLEKKGR